MRRGLALPIWLSRRSLSTLMEQTSDKQRRSTMGLPDRPVAPGARCPFHMTLMDVHLVCTLGAEQSPGPALYGDGRGNKDSQPIERATDPSHAVARLGAEGGAMRTLLALLLLALGACSGKYHSRKVSNGKSLLCADQE